MFIEAIDKLRCIESHEDSWLVAKFVELRDRDFVEGELACPICEARYAVKNGTVYFSSLQKLRPRTAAVTIETSDNLFALAAMLDLSGPERTVVLCDEWTAFAPSLSKLSQPHLFTMNGDIVGGNGERIYQVVSAGVIPLAEASVDAVALGEGSSEQLVHSALKVLRGGGRLIGKAAVAVPPDVVVLASDDSNWVAQKRAAVIPLRRASR